MALARLSTHSGTSGSQNCRKLPAAITSITQTASHMKQYSQPKMNEIRSPNASRMKSFMFRPGYTVAISAIAPMTTSSSRPAKT
ncbi:hypothetical protein D3C74_233850 [compost metagenome]